MHQGLTLVHFSAHNKPFLELEHSNIPAYSIKDAYVEPESGRAGAPAVHARLQRGDAELAVALHGMPVTRGLHSSTSRLNLSACGGIAGPFGGRLGGG